jgi:hypothetical protein
LVDDDAGNTTKAVPRVIAIHYISAYDIARGDEEELFCHRVGAMFFRRSHETVRHTTLINRYH